MLIHVTELLLLRRLFALSVFMHLFVKLNGSECS